MTVAIYKSGPKAGSIASTSDAIIGFSGSTAEALSAFGLKANKLPKSLRAALRRKKSPTYQVEIVKPSRAKENSNENILSNARFSKVKHEKSPLPIHTIRFSKFTESELPNIENVLKDHKKFSIQISPYRSTAIKDFTGTIRIGVEKEVKYLFINDRKSISLKDLGELALTPLD